MQEHEKITKLFFDIIGESIGLMSKVKEEEPPRPFSECLTRVIPKHPKTKEMEKAISLALQFNKQLRAEGISTTPSMEELAGWEMTLNFTAQIFLQSQIIQAIIPISIPPDLKKFLTIVPPEQLKCFDYAFFQIGEKRALRLEGYDNEQVPGLLTKWGYQQISFSDAVPGDLVIYKNNGFPTHMGVYKGEKMVLSKWGNETPVAYLHHALMAPTVYGDKMFFYRPPKSGS